MSFATILVIEDEQHILQSLKTTLIAQSYTIVEAKLGDDALLKLRDNKPDLILLAITIVETTGPELCREIRQGSDVPIIILTVRNVEREKVMALDAGADDYLVRPVGIQELLARVRAALRRAGSLDSQPPFECGDLTIDFEYREVFVRGKRTHVTPKEFALLRLFVANLGKPLPSRRLLQLVWGSNYGDEFECLRVQICQLRKKIEPNPSKPKYICTEPWLGYRFEPVGQAERKDIAASRELR